MWNPAFSSSLMTAPARRRRLAADEADNGFFHVRFDVSGCFFFGSSADFADHDDPSRSGIFVEQPDRIDEVRTDNRIAADADACRLSDFAFRKLADGLVSECPAARNDADVSFKMDVPGHDPDLALARRNNSG